MNRTQAPLLFTLVSLLVLPRAGVAAPAHVGPDAPTPRAAGPAGTPAVQEEQGSGRVPAELGLGLLVGAVGGVVGYIGPGRAACASSDTGLPGCTPGLVIGALVGVGVGVSAGVTWGGMLSDGQGEWFTGALPGMLVGAAAGSGAGLIADNALVALIVAPPLMLVGASIGYELSHKAHVSAQRVQPLVSVTPRGATFGLRGRF